MDKREEISADNRTRLSTSSMLSNDPCSRLRGERRRAGFSAAAVNHRGIRAKNRERVARFFVLVHREPAIRFNARFAR